MASPEHTLLCPEAFPGPQALSLNPKFLHFSSRPCHHSVTSATSSHCHAPLPHSPATPASLALHSPPWGLWPLSRPSGLGSLQLRPPCPRVEVTPAREGPPARRPVLFTTTWSCARGVGRPPQSASREPPQAVHRPGAPERASHECRAPRFRSPSLPRAARTLAGA